MSAISVIRQVERSDRGKREYNRKFRFLKIHGLTLDQYNELLFAQDSKCAICERRVKLKVDHCHLSGKIRGLLCNNCNTGIGLLQESPSILIKAMRYLHRNTPAKTRQA